MPDNSTQAVQYREETRYVNFIEYVAQERILRSEPTVLTTLSGEPLTANSQELSDIARALKTRNALYSNRLLPLLIACLPPDASLATDNRILVVNKLLEDEAFIQQCHPAGLRQFVDILLDVETEETLSSTYKIYSILKEIIPDAIIISGGPENNTKRIKNTKNFQRDFEIDTFLLHYHARHPSPLLRKFINQYFKLYDHQEHHDLTYALDEQVISISTIIYEAFINDNTLIANTLFNNIKDPIEVIRVASHDELKASLNFYDFSSFKCATNTIFDLKLSLNILNPECFKTLYKRELREIIGYIVQRCEQTPNSLVQQSLIDLSYQLLVARANAMPQAAQGVELISEFNEDSTELHQLMKFMGVDILIKVSKFLSESNIPAEIRNQLSLCIHCCYYADLDLYDVEKVKIHLAGIENTLQILTLDPKVSIRMKEIILVLKTICGKTNFYSLFRSFAPDFTFSSLLTQLRNISLSTEELLTITLYCLAASATVDSPGEVSVSNQVELVNYFLTHADRKVVARIFKLMSSKHTVDVEKDVLTRCKGFLIRMYLLDLAIENSEDQNLNPAYVDEMFCADLSRLGHFITNLNGTVTLKQNTICKVILRTLIAHKQPLHVISFNEENQQLLADEIEQSIKSCIEEGDLDYLNMLVKLTLETPCLAECIKRIDQELRRLKRNDVKFSMMVCLLSSAARQYDISVSIIDAKQRKIAISFPEAYKSNNRAQLCAKGLYDFFSNPNNNRKHAKKQALQSVSGGRQFEFSFSCLHEMSHEIYEKVIKIFKDNLNHSPRKQPSSQKTQSSMLLSRRKLNDKEKTYFKLKLRKLIKLLDALTVTADDGLAAMTRIILLFDADESDSCTLTCTAAKTDVLNSDLAIKSRLEKLGVKVNDAFMSADEVQFAFNLESLQIDGSWNSILFTPLQSVAAKNTGNAPASHASSSQLTNPQSLPNTIDLSDTTCEAIVSDPQQTDLDKNDQHHVTKYVDLPSDLQLVLRYFNQITQCMNSRDCFPVLHLAVQQPRYKKWIKLTLQDPQQAITLHGVQLRVIDFLSAMSELHQPVMTFDCDDSSGVYQLRVQRKLLASTPNDKLIKQCKNFIEQCKNDLQSMSYPSLAHHVKIPEMPTQRYRLLPAFHKINHRKRAQFIELLTRYRHQIETTPDLTLKDYYLRAHALVLLRLFDCLQREDKSIRPIRNYLRHPELMRDYLDLFTNTSECHNLLQATRSATMTIETEEAFRRLEKYFSVKLQARNAEVDHLHLIVDQEYAILKNVCLNYPEFIEKYYLGFAMCVEAIYQAIKEWSETQKCNAYTKYPIFFKNNTPFRELSRSIGHDHNEANIKTQVSELARRIQATDDEQPQPSIAQDIGIDLP